MLQTSYINSYLILKPNSTFIILLNCLVGSPIPFKLTLSTILARIYKRVGLIMNAKEYLFEVCIRNVKEKGYNVKRFGRVLDDNITSR